MKRNKIIELMKSKKAAVVVGIFLLTMFVLTVISRVVDSFMTPQVIISPMEEKRLEYQVEVEGAIIAEEMQAVYCEEGVRISQIEVEVNDVVEKDDLLFIIDLDNLDEKITDTKSQIKEAEAQIEVLKTQYNTEVAHKNKNVSRAREDYNDVANSTQNSVDTAYNNMMNAYNSMENHYNSSQGDTAEAVSEWETTKNEMEQNYEDLKQAYNEALNTRNESLKTAGRTMEDADEKITMDSSVTTLEASKGKLDEQLVRLENIKNANGKICSEYYGKVLELNIKTGGTATADAALILADYTKKLKFEGTVDEDARALLSEGLKCQIKMKYENNKQDNNNEQNEDLKISKIIEVENESETESGGYKVTVDLSTADVKSSGAAVLSYTKESETYPSCVPVSALYSDADGYYVLAVAESSTIMGIQSTAEKISVTILEQNSEYAAIEGNFNVDSSVITNASKTVNSGERVRVVEEYE